MLVDGQGSALGLKDPRIVATGQLPADRDHPRPGPDHPVRPGAGAGQHHATAWSAQPLLRSSAQSWTELQPIDDAHPSTIRFDPDKGELRGPLDFGFALSRLSPSPDKNQQRAVVIGDGDFLSNAFIGQAGNRALGERVSTGCSATTR